MSFHLLYVIKYKRSYDTFSAGYANELIMNFFIYLGSSLPYTTLFTFSGQTFFYIVIMCLL